VAKSIQTLANNLSSPLTKEDVLSPINDFLAANAARMTEYIDELSVWWSWRPCGTQYTF
jgi:hypothetical protein